MTIQAPTARVSFVCNGVSTVFPINIQAYLATDFLVLVTNAAGSTTLTLNSDYTLVASGSLAPSFWSLTTQTGQLVSPYVTGNTLQVILNPSETQLSQYTQGQAFPSLSVQTNLDRLTQMVIREGDQLSRAIVAPDVDVNPQMTLPRSALRALQYMAFDAQGNAITVTALPGSNLTQNIFNSFLAGVTFNGAAGDGYGDVYFRRTAAYVGGSAGHVNTCVTVETDVTNSGVTALEWAFLALMHNSSNAGENVAGYFQATKSGTGPTWGAVIEVIEATPVNNPINGTISLEIDMDCNGTDNFGFGSRVGVDLAIRQNQANLPSGIFAQANWGYRIQNGGVVGNSVGFGFALFTGMIANVCFDSSHGTCTTAAYQMAQGQSFIFDGPTNQQNLLTYQGLGIDYLVGGVLKTRLLSSGVGGLQVATNQVVGPRIGGYGTPTGGSHQASFAAGSITLPNLAAAVAQLIVDLETHGMIGT